MENGIVIHSKNRIVNNHFRRSCQTTCICCLGAATVEEVKKLPDWRSFLCEQHNRELQLSRVAWFEKLHELIRGKKYREAQELLFY